MNGVGSGTFSANSDLQPDRCRQLSATGGFSSKGVVKRLVAALVGLVCLGFLSPLAAAPLATPAGLAPGAHFRFIYVTAGTTDAIQPGIAYYNGFVNSPANAAGATYAGATVNWKAIGSTATVDAKDNVGGYGTSVPVYLVNGTRVSNNMTNIGGGLWGSTYTDLLHTVDVGIDGATVNSVPFEAWTGSFDNGTGSSERLGDPTVTAGDITRRDDPWIRGPDYPNGESRRLYAVSEELVVPAATPVPTLSQWAFAVLGLLLAGLALIQFRRSRPTPA